MVRRVSVYLGLIVLAAGMMSGQGRSGALTVPDRPGSARPTRLAKPRIMPLPEGQWTDSHRQRAVKYLRGSRPGNAFNTLINIPELVDSLWPFQNYLTSESTLSPRHREILILRTAWLLGNEYVWAEHAVVAKKSGVTSDELRRIAQGPDAKGWDPFEATLLRVADQLFRNSTVNDAEWKALTAMYDLHHTMDAVMTVSGFTMLSLIYNSAGVQLDEGMTERFPTDIPYRVVVPDREPLLKVARVETPGGKGGTPYGLHPKLSPPRSMVSNYVWGNTRKGGGSKLEPRFREMLILRTGWDCQQEFEWTQHIGDAGRARELGLEPLWIAQGPSAPGWNPLEVLILNAADELYRDSFISDRTWNALAMRFDSTMMMNVVATASVYRFVAMPLNAFGVQIGPDDEKMPSLSRN